MVKRTFQLDDPPPRKIGDPLLPENDAWAYLDAALASKGVPVSSLFPDVAKPAPRSSISNAFKHGALDVSNERRETHRAGAFTSNADNFARYVADMIGDLRYRNSITFCITFCTPEMVCFHFRTPKAGSFGCEISFNNRQYTIIVRRQYEDGEWHSVFSHHDTTPRDVGPVFARLYHQCDNL